MRRQLGRVSVVAVAVGIVLLSQPIALSGQEQALADQEEWSAVQNEVWEQEQAYWRYASAGDVESFMTLWNEQFVGWPRMEEQPVTRSGIRRLFEEVPTGSDLRYELEPLAVNVYGNIGITFYRVVLKNEKGEVTGASRLTHTWRKKDGKWTIIGGMSAPATDTALWQLEP